MKGTSYTEKDFIDNEPHVQVWDDNWDVLLLYRQYRSQWRVGMNGPFALDMNVFQHALDRKQVSGEQYDEMIFKLSIVESEALKWLHRQ